MLKPPECGWTTAATVTRVVDGDTIEVEVTRRLRIRCSDYSSPETRTRDKAEKKRGLAAKAHLQSLIDGEEVVIFIPGDADFTRTTSMSRVLGRIYIGGESVADLMVSSGHATYSGHG